MTGPTAEQRVHGPLPQGQRISRGSAALYGWLRAAPAVHDPVTFLSGGECDFSNRQEH